LIGQNPDDAQTERLILAGESPGRQTDAIVLDSQFAVSGFGLTKGNPDPAGVPVGKSVLEGVRQELVQDQGARDGLFDA